MDHTFEYYFKIFLIVAVLFSLIYNMSRFILGMTWNSVQSEMKAFLSYQYLMLLKYDENDSVERKRAKKILNACHSFQYLLLAILFLGIIASAIIKLEI